MPLDAQLQGAFALQCPQLPVVLCLAVFFTAFSFSQICLSSSVISLKDIQALPEEDVLFFTCKDMSHGIIGIAANGTMAGPYVDPGININKKGERR